MGICVKTTKSFKINIWLTLSTGGVIIARLGLFVDGGTQKEACEVVEEPAEEEEEVEEGD